MKILKAQLNSLQIYVAKFASNAFLYRRLIYADFP